MDYTLSNYFPQPFCALLTWQDPKKTLLILASTNMYFLLLTFFRYSLLSLTLTFLFFLGLLGMGLNIIYRATTDAQDAEDSHPESQLEFVSGETVQDIVLWTFKASLRLQGFLQNVFSWRDARLTVKAVLATGLVAALALVLGDAGFLWLASNVALVMPLGLKRKDVREALERVNASVDGFVEKVPLLKRIEKSRGEQAK